ncbi:pectinesterase family protein, partial [Lachnoanaerobaculum gingivalis]
EYHNKERAAALVCEADNSLFVNCNFKSSQDTLYAGHGKQRFIYCNIYGNIDYIFGEEDARADFIKCNLIWLGYTGEEASLGIICAPKGIFTFYKCRIEKNKDKKYKSIAGYLARPWRASGAVLFYKCDIEENSICKEGFTEMNKVTPEEVAFFEYENICNGKIFITDRGKELF